MNEFRFLVPGEPIAKARPKLGMVAGHAHAFTPKRTRSYEDVVRQRAMIEWKGAPLIAETPISLELVFLRGVPASWSKRRRAEALAGLISPIGKPDLDNLVKAFTDGMNGVIYLDDALIVDTHAIKRYAAEPGVSVTLRWAARPASAQHILASLAIQTAVPREPSLLAEPPPF